MNSGNKTVLREIIEEHRPKALELEKKRQVQEILAQTG